MIFYLLSECTRFRAIFTVIAVPDDRNFRPRKQKPL